MRPAGDPDDVRRALWAFPGKLVGGKGIARQGMTGQERILLAAAALSASCDIERGRGGQAGGNLMLTILKVAIAKQLRTWPVALGVISGAVAGALVVIHAIDPRVGEVATDAILTAGFIGAIVGSSVYAAKG